MPKFYCQTCSLVYRNKILIVIFDGYFMLMHNIILFSPNSANIGANSEESHTTIPDEYEQQFKPSYHQPQLDSVNNILYDEIKQQNVSWSYSKTLS